MPTVQRPGATPHPAGRPGVTNLAPAPPGERRGPSDTLVAYALHDILGMNTDAKSWRPLTPEMIADLPQAAAVFEVANLVRTVHYIGSAGGDLRARLGAFVQEQMKQMPLPGGYYVRYERAAIEEEMLAKRLASYRARHGGRLPSGNQAAAPPLRLTPRRAAA